jgi:hypothetical protein
MNMRYRSLLLLLLTLVSLQAWAAFPQKADGGIEFIYEDAGASNVYIAGEFNGWNASGNVMSQDDEGRWRTVLALGPGSHEYKYVVDGNWIADPDNPETGGDYGNSVIKVKANGEVEEPGGGKRPSPLNSKVFVDGIYYSNMSAEAIKDQNRRMMFNKPDHDLNLGFVMELNPSLVGRVEVNANNLAESSEMWKTRLNFQRSRLQLTRPSFSMLLFDNDAAFRSDDLLELAGNDGTYNYALGYGARGALVTATTPGAVQASLYVSDATAALSGLPIIIAQVDSLLLPRTSYEHWRGANLRDDLVLQLSRNLGPAKFLYLAKATRGINGGGIVFYQGDHADSLVSQGYSTVQNNLLHALNLSTSIKGHELSFEWLTGGADLDAIIQTSAREGDEDVSFAPQTDKSWHIQDTRGGAIALGGALPWSLRYELGHEFQENRNSFTYLENVDDLNAQRRQYRGALYWEGENVSYGLEASQEEYDYPESMPWRDQFAYEYGSLGAGNLWIHGDRLPLENFTVLGYSSASRLRQSLHIDLEAWISKPVMLDISHTATSTRLDRDPFYSELIAELVWKFRKDWDLLLNQRYARYGQDFLDLHETFANSFFELRYHVTKSTEVSLGWGVDPYRLDPVTKQFDDNGRREFLLAAGVAEDVIYDEWLNLGPALHSAERSLADTQMLTLEARFVF